MPATTTVLAAGAAGGLTATASSASLLAIGLGVGALGLGLAVGLGAPKVGSQARLDNVRIPVGPRRRGFGMCRIGGNIVFAKRGLNAGGDGVLYMGFALNSGRIDAIEEHWIDDQITRIDPNVEITVEQGNVIYPGIWYDNSRITIQEHLGEASQEADQLFLWGFPGTWTEQHRLDGIAYTAIRFKGVGIEDFHEVYKFGVPSYAAKFRASCVWDPRESAQDPHDESTWTWTDNAALVILDYLRHQDGMRLPYELIEPEISHWIAQANLADQQVTLLSGETEARYRLWGSYEFNEEPKAVLGTMLRCVDGRVRLSENGGVILELGQFDCPGACETIRSTDILRVEKFRRGASKDDLRNEIRSTYCSPGHRLQDQEADPWRNEESILIDGLQSAQLDLKYCPSHRQARQLMKIASYRMNPEWMGTIVTNGQGLRLLGKRYARFIIDALGINTTFFINRADIDLKRGICTFDVISFPPEAYCWEPCEEGESPEYEAPGMHGICVPPGAIGVRIRAIGGGGGGSEDKGGDGGGYSVKYIALSPEDEGTVFLFTVGAAGIGTIENAMNLATAGGASTVTGTVAAGSVNISAGGGAPGHLDGTGGVATGGDTNINGTASSGGDGGLSGAGTNENESPGGGGHEQVDGGIGEVTFEWVY